MSQSAAGAGNPFKIGFVGDTDTHNAAASHAEFNYTGKFAFENNAKERLTGVPGQPAGQIQQIQGFSSGGLAGVWAPQNNREAIWDAMQRKETFGTSGPMMMVRFFGSFDYAADDVNKADFVKLAYARGVPMGGDPKPAFTFTTATRCAAPKPPISDLAARLRSSSLVTAMIVVLA